MATSKELASGLTQEFLTRHFHYDPDTGKLTWAEPLAINHVNIGDEAGRLHHRGYRRATINYAEYAVHRLIWLMVTGEWPTHQIDHIDRDRANNRWANLRGATYRDNSYNRTPSKRNSSGVVGVSFFA